MDFKNFLLLFQKRLTPHDIIKNMKLFGFEMKRTPRPINNRLVNAVSTIFEPERTEIWTAIGKLREDLTATNRLAMATQRQLYRKIGPQEPEDGTAIVDAPPIVSKTQGHIWRTGDPVN